MPDLQWNRRWRDDLAQWQAGDERGEFGDQWGDPEEVDCLSDVRDRFVLPHVSAHKTALEIGSGGGRWTQYLLGFGRLYCVDLNPEMFHYLLRRFGPRPHVGFCQTAGTDFPGIPTRSLDFVFSFGTLVHLDPPLIERYLANLSPLVRPGADVVLQYADKEKPLGASNAGFAQTTSAVMRGLLERSGYEVVEEDARTLPHSNVVRARPRAAAGLRILERVPPLI